MATTLERDDILKAARAMSKQERLELIAEIAALPDEATGAPENPDDEVMKTAHQIMDKYSNLLRRLAE